MAFVWVAAMVINAAGCGSGEERAEGAQARGQCEKEGIPSLLAEIEQSANQAKAAADAAAFSGTIEEAQSNAQQSAISAARAAQLANKAAHRIRACL